MTEVALCGHCSSSGTGQERLWGSGEYSCHSLVWYFIPDPNTLLLLPSQVLGHQTGFKHFGVANQKLDLNPSTTKSSFNSGGITSFSNASKWWISGTWKNFSQHYTCQSLTGWFGTDTEAPTWVKLSSTSWSWLCTQQPWKYWLTTNWNHLKSWNARGLLCTLIVYIIIFY